MAERWDWMRDLVTLQDRMNQLFQDAARRRGTENEEEEAGVEMEREDWYPAADVYENAGQYTIILDLPGIERAALDVSLDEDRLTIKGERVAVAEAGQQRRAERPFGRFIRSFTLPPTVEREGIRADYKDGVLRVVLPKRTEQKSRRIEIKVA